MLYNSMPHIKSITVARLFNLGNYEHKRIELTVDLNPGDHAGDIQEEVSKLLETIGSKCPVDEWSIRNDARILGMKAHEMGDAEIGNLPQIKERKAQVEAWIKARKDAVEALNAYGASTVFSQSNSDDYDHD